MALFTFGQDMPAYGNIQSLFDIDSLSLDTGSSSSTEVTFVDGNGYTIVLKGSGLTFAGGAMTAGNVTAIDFLDDVGGDLLTVTSANYSAVAITAKFEDNPDLWEFLKILSAGNDTIHGNDNGTDLNISEDHGNDKIFAGSGGSYVSGSEGKDTLRGGDGWDTLSFEETYYRQETRHGIVLDAAKGTVIDSWGDKDKFSRFEEYGGSIFKDIMTGSKRDDTFFGLEGKDTIDGGKGWDQVRYQRDEKYDGEAGIKANLAKNFVIDGFGDKDKVLNVEAVIGTHHNDSFTGSKADNWFMGLDGVDKFDGGKGTDVIQFSYWEDLGQTGVFVDLSLSSGQVIDDGFGNTETLKSIEAVDGSTLADNIKLGNADGWAWGNDGDDFLLAGKGVQWFGGGAGEDTFIFGALNTLGNSKATRDQIDDFSQADGDQIDLSGIGTLFLGGEGALTGEAGELRYVITGSKTILSGDIDGNGKADFQIQINKAVEFEEGDFILSI